MQTRDTSAFWSQPLPDDLRDYAVADVMRDGESIEVRAIRSDDKERLADHFHRLSPGSIRFRFMGFKKRLSEEELIRFTELDFETHVGLAAVRLAPSGERIIGVGRFIRCEAGGEAKRAEVAFAVDDAHQGRGIGTLLLLHLAHLARSLGIESFEADVLGENNRMLEVFANSGFRVSRAFEGGVFHISFPTEETPAVLEAEHARERHAVAESLRPILEPRAVAVVGASNRPRTIGHALVSNLQRGGFTGSIHPIHPREREIGGLPAFAHVSDVGSPVDLAVIAVPADAVEEVVNDCARAGVRGLIVISAGFAETSEEGRAAELRLRDRVRAFGMRLVGPNCMGVLNSDPAIRLDATFAPTEYVEGAVSLYSQSGALGIAVLETTLQRGVGISSFVSSGNKADVSGNDLLAYWGADPRTRVIALYLESLGNPRKFARVAPEVARIKPIVAIKAGRSAAGSRAAASHTAALASRDVAVDALFEQAGVLRVPTLESLLDVAELLSTQPLPAGARVGIVTNAGGPGILLADACEDGGLSVPALAAATRDKLSSILPPHAGLVNPVDTIASATPDELARAIAVVGGDLNVDAVVVVHVRALPDGMEEVARAIAAGAAEVPPGKPVLVVLAGVGAVPSALHSGARGRLPLYRFPENAARALGAANRYSLWRRRPLGEVLVLDSFAKSAIRAVVERVLDAATAERAWLEPADVATVLRSAGIRYADAIVTQASDAARDAKALGFPLVAKAVAPGLLHKSDVGGVILGLEDEGQVEDACRVLEGRVRAAGKSLDGVLLQREVKDGVEALVGVAIDPTFGPLVACGLGGVNVELLKDVSFHLTPLSDVDAAEMVDRLRARAILDGYRGAPAADRLALLDLVQRVAALVDVVPELEALDLNPVKVLAQGQGAIVVDARLCLRR